MKTDATKGGVSSGPSPLPKAPTVGEGRGLGEGGRKVTERLVAYAKDLRSASTDAERILWSHIRAKRLDGLKFRRQHPIGEYIVDFVCLERKIVVELDGSQHAALKSKEYDRKRDAWLKKEGYTVLRFWDNEFLLKTREVLEVIREHCLRHPPPAPSPQGRGTR